MRIRTFTAASMAEAMALVREAMGDEAIIVSSHENPRGRGVEVRAAVEEAPTAPVAAFRPSGGLEAGPESDLSQRLRQSILGELRDEIASTRRRQTGTDADHPALTTPRREPIRAFSKPAYPRSDDPAKSEGETGEGWVRTGIAGVIQGQAQRRIEKLAPRIPDAPPASLDIDSPSAKEPRRNGAAKPGPTIEARPLAPPPEDADALSEALAYHGVPEELASRLLTRARTVRADTPALRLGAAIDDLFAMDMVSARPRKPIMLVGPPGSGKTVTLAKLSAQSVLAGHPVAVYTTDTLRAGAIEQLSSFTDILGQDLLAADNPEDLADQIRGGSADAAVFVDTPATNPFVVSELRDLERFIEAGTPEPILVLNAGMVPHDAAEMARAFARIGVKRMIATRIDAARRIGSLLAAADAGRMALAQISITPYVAQGLNTINPVSLARLLLDYPFPHGRLDDADAPLTPAQSAALFDNEVHP